MAKGEDDKREKMAKSLLGKPPVTYGSNNLTEDFKEQIISEIQNDINDRIIDAQKILSDTYTRTAVAIKEDSAAREKAEKKLNDIISSGIQDIEDDGKKLAADLEDIKTVAVNTVLADGILKDAASLWKAEKSTHTWIFFVTAVIFLAGVTALIIGLYCWSIPILNFLKQTHVDIAIDQGVSSSLSGIEVLYLSTSILSRLLLVSLPIAMIIWVLRSFLRVALTQLTLREDAALRSVMVRTYVNLVSSGTASDENERVIILSAIFRPLPGDHQPDISPPNISDMMKSVQK